MTDKMLSPKQTAEMMGISPLTLKKARCLGEGAVADLPYTKYSSRCYRYRLSDIEAWLAERAVNNAGGAA